ncbi:uncharacterized protein THITE_162022 [Thermothielavioides terrestris NRRL 8126]|uniref:Rhodopsin domain-containing protein n=1 Tax=Thermothielavioides terrestris (strain ATCC 38088 / NRRL 8126) TaxID=578455 RepID=G2R462_THETT|nr:uncharacterized protein THITE_162022 [Thermothielavioides terrestris NRRL 8126]AEO65204.1 hypothetical protein THITE_162022 [Thermothielavioides terrestris NRRL 8126]
MASITQRASAVETHGPKVNIVIWLLMALSAVFLGLRVFCKLATHRRLWWDDHILIVGWTLQLAAVSLITVNITLGFGRHVIDIDPANISQIALISNVVTTLSMLAAVLTKTSFGLTLLRISDGYMKLFIWVAICIMNIAMGLGALFQWVQCTPARKVWDFSVPGTCWDQNAMTAYAIFAAAISGAMDATLSLLPWKII